MRQPGDRGAVVPWVLLELGWSAKGQPPPGVWTGKGGLRTTGDPRFGVPFGLDRNVVLGLAREGRRRGASFGGNLRDIPAAFGLRERPATTLARLRRVAHCWYERPERAGVALCRRYGFIERLEVCAETGDYAVTLSAEFMAEIAAGAPISMEVVRALANKPGTLDLYLWQAWQVARGTAASVSICGAGGPCVMLPCASDRSRAEQEIRHHNALIRAAWPESPYEIAPDGKGLVYEPAAGAETAADSEMGADAGQATCGPGEHISGTAENHGSSGPAPPRAGVVGATARSDARPSVTAGLDARPGGRASSEPATGPPQAPVIDLAAAGLASATTGHRRTLRRRRRRKKRRKRSR